MAETSNANAEDSILWSPAKEEQFILLLLEIAATETARNGKRKSKDWRAIAIAFNERIRSREPYSSIQLLEKHKRLRNGYNLFSQLLQSPGMGWDARSNTVTGDPEAWANALTSNKKFDKFRSNALNNYELLSQLFAKDAQTPSAQPDTAEGGHPTGTNTTSGLKRKAPSFDSVPCDGDPYSMAEVMCILNSLSDLPMETYCKALDRLERPEKRATLVAMIPERRRGWIEHLARKPEGSL